MPSKVPAGTPTPAGWTPSGAATVHEAVAVADAAYAVATDGSACVLALDPADNPNELTGHTIAVTCEKAVDLLQTVALRVELMEGATVIATLDVADVPSVADTFTHGLSEAEAAVIVDYAALTLRITDVASPLLSEVRVGLVEFVIPERRLRVHCGG